MPGSNRKTVRQRDRLSGCVRDETKGTAQDGHRQMPTVSPGPLPVNLMEHGLVAALRELAENVQSIFQISCTFDCEADVMIRDNTVATHLFRIVQEAVYNAARHATPDEIRIRLSAGAGRLVLTVTDDGIGLPQEGRHTGMGLRIMDFRADMIPGSTGHTAARRRWHRGATADAKSGQCRQQYPHFIIHITTDGLVQWKKRKFLWSKIIPFSDWESAN